MTQTLLLLPGDGIGPEVCAEALRVAQTVAPDLAIADGLLGGASIDAHGEPLTAATLTAARAADAVLMGAVGGPQWAGAARHLRPEMGLLQLRQGLGVYANLRPAVCFPALVAASSLKPEIVAGLDILIVRELTGGVYFGTPRGIETLPDGTRRGLDTQVYTTPEIERVARVAFRIAASRAQLAAGRRYAGVCSVDKANVMESGLLWRETVTACHAAETPPVELHHMYADACAMELVRRPGAFDVILADNLFGDILSDEAAMLTGSIGMLPSASLDANNKGLYEPSHGSAPDIAGKGVANPLATILSAAMMLRYSLNKAEQADRIETAVKKVLAQGYRTGDILTPGCKQVGTVEMGDAVVAVL